MAGRSRPRRGSSNPYFAYLGAVCCSALAVASGYVLVLEARPYFLSGLESAARVRALADLDMTPGPSNFSQRMVLDDCFASSRSLLAKASPSPVRARLLAHCDGLAAAITAAADTGLCVVRGAAVAAERTMPRAERGAGAIADHSAVRGLAAAARVELAEANFARLDAAALAAEAADSQWRSQGGR